MDDGGGGAVVIREWAKAHGIHLGRRGRIQHDVIDAYKRAHGIGQVGKVKVHKGGGARWRVETGEPVNDVHCATWREAYDYAYALAARRRAEP